MPNPTFPQLSQGALLDARQFAIQYEDPAQRTEMEGGYVITRAKHTRAPRRTFNVVYRQLNADDKLLIEAFYDSVKGGSVIFDWINPQNLLTYQVRMKASMSLAHVGRGFTQRWDCSMVLEQA